MREKIEQYIHELAAQNNITVNNSTDLFEAGVLDSLGIVLLLVFINEKLGVELNIGNLEADKFKTIDSIVEFLG